MKMTDEDTMLPRIKRVSKEKKKLKIPVLNILLVLFCSFLLMAATFIQINITHFIIPLDIFSNKALTKADFLYTYSIIPQVPAVMFIVGLLGRRLGLTSIVIYILTGLFLLPVFALGGGARYILEPGFGYIIAYFIVGRVFFEVETFLQVDDLFLLDGQQAVAESKVTFRLFQLDLAHQGEPFPHGFNLFRIEDANAVDFAFGGCQFAVGKHLSGVLEACRRFFSVAVAARECGGE